MKTILKAILKIVSNQKDQQKQLDEIQEAVQLLIKIKTEQLRSSGKLTREEDNLLDL